MSPSRAARKVTDKVARVSRTAGQAGVPAAVIYLLQALGWIDLSAEQALGVGAAATTIVAWVQATVENWLGRGIFRKVPARPARVPVVDEEGAS